MMLTSTLENIGIVDAGVVAVLGYVVVFVGLIMLQMVLVAMGKAFMAKDKKASEKVDLAKLELSNPAPVVHAAPVAAAPAADPNAAAPGTAGKLKIHDVPPKTAAMIMAIVANKMGKPLNELRFISIKEVK